jgi:hypothetical protein
MIGGNMEQKHTKQQTLSQVVRQLGQVYGEVLAGRRNPEQLSRWLDEKTYLQVASEHAMFQRMRLKNRGALDTGIFEVRKSAIFPCKKNSLEAVVLLQNGKIVRAVSMRMDYIHQRWRITFLELI